MSISTKQVKLGHGGGGRMAIQFLDEVIRPRFSNTALDSLDDAALLKLESDRIAMSSDSMIVKPVEFAGGNIGKLAICGTANDLAVSGARPRFLSMALIIEEGLDFALLERLLDSAAETASSIGVSIVCGDTKVVPRGEVDGIFFNTTGIGELDPRLSLGIGRIRTGDAVLSSGTLGDHGATIMVARESLGITGGLSSDCAPVAELCSRLYELGNDLHFMRDPTRGGLIAVASEIVHQQKFSIRLFAKHIPLKGATRAACELVGVDPLSLACEGRVITVVAADAAESALELMRADPLGAEAAIIGEVIENPAGRLLLQTSIGTERVIIQADEDPLPRIC